jgi:hypothetical protein
MTGKSDDSSDGFLYDLNIWRNHYVTKAVLSYLQNISQQSSKELSSLYLLADSHDDKLIKLGAYSHLISSIDRIFHELTNTPQVIKHFVEGK